MTTVEVKAPARAWRKRSRLLRLLVIGAALVGAIYWGYREWTYHRLREAALKDVTHNQMPRARAVLENLAQRRPTDAEVLYQLGVAALASGDRPRALRAWRDVPGESDFAGRASVMLARDALQSHHLAEAEPLMLRAVGETGAHAKEAIETLVHLYKIEGRFLEARRLVRKYWDRYPDPIGVLKELAQLDSIKPYALDRARAALARAYESAPDDDRIWLGWGNLATRMGQFADAKAWLDRCAQTRPNDMPVWRGQLALALAMQDESTAKHALAHLPAEEMSSDEVLELRAWFASRQRDEPAELAATRALVSISPANLPAIERLAELEQHAGRREEAERLRARKSELDRAKAQYEIILFFLESANTRPTEMARFAETLSRPLEAGILWRIALKRDSTDPEAIAGLGRATAQHSAPVDQSATLTALLDDLNRTTPVVRPARLVHGGVPQFRDEAESAGLRFQFESGMSPLRQLPETMSGGVALIDYDNDGWLDVYCVQGGTFPPPTNTPPPGDRLFHNRGDGTFEDATASSGIANLSRGYGHGVTVGDYDNDGYPDLFITRWRSYALFHNKRNGTFEEVTSSFGLDGDRDWPTSAAFADLDNDGDLDLYVCHYLAWDATNPQTCTDPKRPGNVYCGPPRFPSMPDHVFRNDRTRFVDITSEAGIVDRHGQGLGVAICDFDGDGRPDIFVANDQTANYLYHNQGGFRFREVGELSGVAASAQGVYQASMGVAVGDQNRDGLPDLAITNFYNEGTTLYRNLGTMAFADHTTESNLMVLTRYMLGFGVAFADMNSDGYLDIIATNGHVDDFRPDEPYKMPAQLLLGTRGERFVDASKEAGAPFRADLLGRGLAVGDLDHDGRVDCLILPQNSPMVYLHNQAANAANWLVLSLEGTKSNRDAVGAKVVVKTKDQTFTSWRIGGGSYQSSNSPHMHFGLAKAETADVEVTWPNGKVESFGAVKTAQGYALREGEGTPRPLKGYQPR